MSDLAGNFAALHERIARACDACGRDAGEVELLAVSKRHPADVVRAAMALGQVCFGENRVQELVQKAQQLTDVAPQWHLIGSLQTNKVRDVVALPALSMIHSVDRARLADELQKELVRAGRELDILLQANASQEEQKHGCALDEVPALLDHVQQHCPSLRVCGLMAMGPLHGETRPVFERTAALRGELCARSGLALPTLSLGMSGDLEAAIAAGSTMVRVGTALFGQRD